MRGRDNVGTGAAGNDPSGNRAIGNLQTDAFQGHWHLPSLGTRFLEYTSTSNIASGGGNANGEFQSTATGSPTTDGANGTPRTATETRPKNVALTFCMRKN